MSNAIGCKRGKAQWPVVFSDGHESIMSHILKDGVFMCYWFEVWCHPGYWKEIDIRQSVPEFEEFSEEYDRVMLSGNVAAWRIHTAELLRMSTMQDLDDGSREQAVDSLLDGNDDGDLPF